MMLTSDITTDTLSECRSESRLEIPRKPEALALGTLLWIFQPFQFLDPKMSINYFQNLSYFISEYNNLFQKSSLRIQLEDIRFEQDAPSKNLDENIDFCQKTIQKLIPLQDPNSEASAKAREISYLQTRRYQKIE
jgi:hypothetical protein